MRAKDLSKRMGHGAWAGQAQVPDLGVMDIHAGLQVLVINLDRSPDRLAVMRQRLSRTGLPWRRVTAVDGHALDLPACAELDIKGYQRRHGKALNPAEAGCYFPHIEALRQFLAGPCAHALVLEDDADFPFDFSLLLRRLMAVEHLWDIVKLSSFHSGTPVRIADLNPPHALAIPLSRHMNANSLLFNRRAAQVLLERLLPMRLPYDHALERAWLYGLRLRVVTPSPCPSSTGLASTICDHRLARAFKFPLYRRMLAMLFRLHTELLRVAFGLAHVLRARVLRLR